MALIDNFAPDIEERKSAHGFASMVAIGANGTLGNAATARARIISEFNLQASDEAQLDSIIALIQAAPTKADRMAFARDLEDSLIAFEGGLISAAEVAANIGI